LRRQISCRRFFLPCISASAASFHGLRQCLAARRACLSCVSFCRSRAGRFLTSSAALVISLPPLPGSGKTEHRFCAFLPPSRRPFLGPVRRISRLYFCRVFQPQAARR